MKKLKTLKIKDTTFLYEIVYYHCGDYGVITCGKTVFYNPRPIIKTRKKYWLWGPEIQYTEYEELFTINSDIESHDLSKKDITKMLNKEIALLNRKEEIKRGEIIETEEDAKIFVEAITNPPAPNDKLKEAAATHLKKYTDKDMTSFVSFVGKNYIKAKGFYYMKGDIEKKTKVSIHQILKNFNQKKFGD